ncbi:MAG: hypothetical protein IKN55_07435, partial [Oscillospiraceae bacterium]|nr:hypothetical protein [Oscillospiraceae bacterium]
MLFASSKWLHLKAATLLFFISVRITALVKLMHDGYDVAVTTAVADGMKTTKKKGCVTGLATQP